MEKISMWVMGITAAAMLVAVADSLTPPGTVKKIARFTGGLVLLLAVISPVSSLDFTALSRSLVVYREDLNEYQATAGTGSIQVMKIIIADKTSAYIVDKAVALGVICTAEVTCTVGEEDVPYPSAVTVTGNFTDAQEAALTRQIEADLAIPASSQRYESEEAK